MQKVSWPKQSELMGFTAITVIATIIISLFIFGADRLISIVLEFYLRGRIIYHFQIHNSVIKLGGVLWPL